MRSSLLRSAHAKEFHKVKFSLALTGQEPVQLDQEGQVDVLGLGGSSVRMLLVLLGERVFSHC